MGQKRRNSTSSLLHSRVKSYAAHNDVAIPETVADALRGMYQEYVRLPRAVFVKNVQRAIQQYTVSLAPEAGGKVKSAAEESSEEEEQDGPPNDKAA